MKNGYKLHILNIKGAFLNFIGNTVSTPFWISLRKRRILVFEAKEIKRLENIFKEPFVCSSDLKIHLSIRASSAEIAVPSLP